MLKMEKKERGKYKTLTQKEKLAIIDEVDKGKKKKDVAAQFKINTLSTIYKKKDKELENNGQLKKKRMREAKNSTVDAAVKTFINQVRQRSIPVNGKTTKPNILAKC